MVSPGRIKDMLPPRSVMSTFLAHRALAASARLRSIRPCAVVGHRPAAEVVPFEAACRSRGGRRVMAAFPGTASRVKASAQAVTEDRPPRSSGRLAAGHPKETRNAEAAIVVAARSGQDNDGGADIWQIFDGASMQAERQPIRIAPMRQCIICFSRDLRLL